MPVSEDGVFHSQAIPGFWLKLQWVFAEEPLDILDTVMTILTGNNKGVTELWSIGNFEPHYFNTPILHFFTL